MNESVEIPDAAVEAAAKAACEAAYPPNPSGRVKVHDSWEETEEWERDAWRATARAALVAARPYLMPTREDLVTVIGDALWFEEHPERTGAEINNVAADAVLALLNGTES